MQCAAQAAYTGHALYMNSRAVMASVAFQGKLLQVLGAHKLHNHVVSSLQDLDERLRCGSHASQNHAKRNPAHPSKVLETNVP